ncbi:MAG TPA: PilZ domain-containing protein [Vicinamibacterales bacterium]|nr:PilZ domain-containing protein [Vicinamibacterales bacterium]
MTGKDVKDQRRTPRIDVRHRLRARLVSLDRPVLMRDFSVGGFALESDDSIPAGTHIVRIQEGERWSVTVTASSRHAQTAEAENGAVRYVVGFEIADQSPDTQHTIRVLYERLAADEP